MKIIDCLMFNDECEILRLRLELLAAHVDHFVISEASTTHSGRPRRPLSELCGDLYERYAEKIVLVQAPEVQAGDNRWLREMTQRNALSNGLNSLNLSQDDLVIISDVDEIPDPQVFRKLGAVGERVIALEQSWRLYFLDLGTRAPWTGSKICSVSTLNVLTPSEVRHCFTPDKVLNAGWHLSYMHPRASKAEGFKEKISNFAHSELEALPTFDWPKERIGGFLRISHMGHQLVPLGLTSLPDTVVKSPEEWSDYLLGKRGASRLGRAIRGFIELLGLAMKKLHWSRSK